MASPRGEGFSPNRCLQNNDCFVPKPLRFKCLRILPLFCVICARRKNASAFSALLVVIPSVSEESPGKDYQQISSRPSGRLFLSPPLLTIHLLIVVIAIMAILAAVLVPTVVNRVKDAKKAAAESDAQSIAKSLSLGIAESEDAITTLAQVKTILTSASYTVTDNTDGTLKIETKNDTFTISLASGVVSITGALATDAVTVKL